MQFSEEELQVIQNQSFFKVKATATEKIAQQFAKIADELTTIYQQFAPNIAYSPAQLQSKISKVSPTRKIGRTTNHQVHPSSTRQTARIGNRVSKAVSANESRIRRINDGRRVHIQGNVAVNSLSEPGYG